MLLYDFEKFWFAFLKWIIFLVHIDLNTYLYISKYTCMTTKLTLTMDDEVIKKAKGYAAGKGRSLSELVENYFLSLTYGNVPTDKDELTPAVRSLMGSFKAPKGFDFDYKKVLREEKSKKHG